MRSRHSSREEISYRSRRIGNVEYFTSRYGHGDASMVVYRFARTGDPDGPDFVLVHGIGVSARMYGPTAAALAGRGDVHLVDLPGYGRSPRPDTDMTIERHAEVLADYLADHQLDHPVVVGHSMGTQVVAQLAYARPDLVDHIALIAPVVTPDARSLARVAGLLLRDSVKEPPLVGLIAINDYLFRAGIGYMAAQTPHLLNNKLEDIAGRVQAKTLVICGEDDPIVPVEWGRHLADSFPQGWFVTVPGPHASMFAAPESIANALSVHARR